jgi:hypothetical protein
MAGFKQIRVGEGSQRTVTVRPVVLQVPLTPNQIATVARFTGKHVTALELSQEELATIVGASCARIMSSL